MAYVIAAPEMMTAAATDLATIASNVSAAHLVAAAPTVAVVPAAADEASAGIAQVFSKHAQDYQALAGKAAAFQEQFVQHLTASADSYASAEAANAASLPPLGVILGSFADLPRQITQLLNASLGWLLNSLSGFWNELPMFLLAAALGVVFVAILAFAVAFGIVQILFHIPIT